MKTKLILMCSIICLLTSVSCSDDSFSKVEINQEYIDVSFSDKIFTKPKMEQYIVAKERFYEYVQKD